MATQEYAASIQGVSIRVTRLDASGNLLNEAGDSYTTSAFMRISFTPEYEEGDEIVEKSANGSICVSYKAPDTLKRVTMELAICEPDPELTNLLSGGLLLRKTTSQSVGLRQMLVMTLLVTVLPSKPGRSLSRMESVQLPFLTSTGCSHTPVSVSLATELSKTVCSPPHLRDTRLETTCSTLVSTSVGSSHSLRRVHTATPAPRGHQLVATVSTPGTETSPLQSTPSLLSTQQMLLPAPLRLLTALRRETRLQFLELLTRVMRTPLLTEHGLLQRYQAQRPSLL